MADIEDLVGLDNWRLSHFDGVWKRGIKSVKSHLQVVLKDRVLPEDVLMTVLIELEALRLCHMAD